jgi:transitional endoplasmic reticulum ATPase
MIWRRYVAEITDEHVDIEALVAASELFTPADIEFAARKAAQRAFEREHFEGAGERARTEEFLAAISETRPSLSDDLIASFDADTQRFRPLLSVPLTPRAFTRPSAAGQAARVWFAQCVVPPTD